MYTETLQLKPRRRIGRAGNHSDLDRVIEHASLGSTHLDVVRAD
jgi:hypothetical protein